jgi:hypothetical protein
MRLPIVGNRGVMYSDRAAGLRIKLRLERGLKFGVAMVERQANRDHMDGTAGPEMRRRGRPILVVVP